MRSKFGYTMLCAIRKPASAIAGGDRKIMTLLPSFNGTKTRTKSEIPTSQDYLITDIKRFATLDPSFFIKITKLIINETLRY